MKERYFIDSSLEDNEATVIREIVLYKDYLEYLSVLFNFDNIKSSVTLKYHFGLLIHNLAERVFWSKAIHDIYLEKKSKKIGLEESKYQQLISEIKIIFDEFIDVDDKQDYDPYIKLFNFIFDQKLSLPSMIRLKNKIDISDLRSNLLEKLRIAENINWKFLNWNPCSLKINSESENKAAEILSCASLANRSNKNRLKFLKIKMADNFSADTTYTIPGTHLETFTDTNVYHYNTGNVQTEIRGLKTYNQFIDKIPKDDVTRQLFVKYMFDIIKYDNPDTILNFAQKSIAEQLTHLLFISEMHRSKATLFMAPIFLELIKDNAEDILIDNFPMAMKDAVAFSRDINLNYTKKISHPHIIDYDLSNVKDGKILIRKESEILIKWLSLMSDKQSNFDDLFAMMDNYKNINFLLMLDNNDISIDKLIDLIHKINLIRDIPGSLTSGLSNSLSELSANLLERSKQKLQLGKNVLKNQYKNKPEILKKINNVYTEFNKIKDELSEQMKIVHINVQSKIIEIFTIIVSTLSSKIKEWYDIDLTTALDFKLIADMVAEDPEFEDEGFEDDQDLEDDNEDTQKVETLGQESEDEGALDMDTENSVNLYNQNNAPPSNIGGVKRPIGEISGGPTDDERPASIPFSSEQQEKSLSGAMFED